MKRFLNHYLGYVDYKIDKTKSIQYFRMLKDKLAISTYRKQMYQILKFLRHLKVDWAEEIGADGWADDAIEAVSLIKKLLNV